MMRLVKNGKAECLRIAIAASLLSICFFDNPNCNFNITLSKTDSLLTEVGINVFYRCDWKYVPYGSNGITMLPGTPLQGNSTGNFEKEIFEYISK